MSQKRWEERLVHYQYIHELLVGRRVLEIGCGSSTSIDLLADLTKHLMVMDVEPEKLAHVRLDHSWNNVEYRVGEPDRLQVEDGAFDVVLVPELKRWVTRGALMPEICRVLTPDGLALFVVPSGDDDNPGGMAYADFEEYLTQSFDFVRMIGVIPFRGNIIADFNPDEELVPQLDCSLIEEDEAPGDYMALCSMRETSGLGYCVVQVPPESDATAAELSAQGQINVFGELLERSNLRIEALEDRLSLERDRVENERERVQDLTRDFLQERGLLETERVRTAAAERRLSDNRATFEEYRQRAESAERRCDSLLIRIEQGAGELSSLHQRMAEMQGLRQADRWQIDELTGRLRDQQTRTAGAPPPAGEEDPGAQQELEGARARVAELEQELAGLKDRAATEDSQPERRAAEAVQRAVQEKKVASEAQRQVKDAHHRIRELEKQLVESGQRLSQMEQLADQQEEERTRLESEQMKAESREEEHRRRATNFESQIVQMEVRLKRSEKEAATLSKWAEELREELKEAQGKSSALPVTHEPEVQALRNDLAAALTRNESLEERCDRFIKEAEESQALKQELKRLKTELETSSIELARSQDEGRGSSGLPEEAGWSSWEEEEEEEYEVEGYVGTEMTDADEGEDEDEEGWSSTDDLMRVRERQIEALLEGAAMHREETERLRVQISEMDGLVEELQIERQQLEQELAALGERQATEAAELRGAREDNRQQGRELAQVQGTLKRCQQELEAPRDQPASAPPPASAGAGQVPTREDLDREIRGRRQLQQDLEARLVELDEVRKVVLARDRTIDRLGAEDTAQRAELRELRRQADELSRQNEAVQQVNQEQLDRIANLEQAIGRGGSAAAGDATSDQARRALELELERALERQGELEERREVERELRVEANHEIDRRQAEVERLREQVRAADVRIRELTEGAAASETDLAAVEQKLVRCEEQVREQESRLAERREQVEAIGESDEQMRTDDEST